VSAPTTADAAAEAQDARLGWVFTVFAVLPSFAYILAASLVPAFLSRPVASGTPVTWGLVLGLALAVFLVVIAMVYTRRLNRRERERERERARAQAR
jgi:uncharacterized membrane protein (DUF485 family)